MEENIFLKNFKDLFTALSNFSSILFGSLSSNFMQTIEIILKHYLKHGMTEQIFIQTYREIPINYDANYLEVMFN